MTHPVPPAARWLGALGLAPQAAMLVILLTGDPASRFSALAMAFAYAALIFSFLGGLWWGLASAAANPPRWLWVAAVMPSLVALALCIPWAIGTTWPGPSMLWMGAAIIASLLVDVRLVAIGIAPSWWIHLRAPLSLVLGGLTIAIGVLSF